MNRKVTALLAISGFALAAVAGPEEDGAVGVSNQVSPPIIGLDDAGDPCEAFDTQTATGDNRLLGTEYAWGYFWVTGAGPTGGPAGEQKIYQFDGCWNLVETYLQTTFSATWGGRDMDAIESENLLFCGAESGEFNTYVFDPVTERLDLTQTTSEVTQVIGTVRALAYHPIRQTFFTKSFGGDITEFDRSGVEVNFWPDPGVSAYGAAYDPLANTIWFNAYCGQPCIDAGTSAPGTVLFEWDPETGMLTGREIDMQDLKYAPAGWIGWIPGGLDSFLDGDQLVFLAHNQANPRDYATILLGDGTGGCPDLCAAGCYADCDGSGALDFFDFLCYQNAFAAGDPYADCDASGVLDFFDFLCYQNEFAAGCP